MAINIVQARDLCDEQQVVQDAHAMQREAAKEVPFMNVLAPEMIQELVRDGSLRCICNEGGETVSTFYLRKTGLRAKGKEVYSLGGLSFLPEKRKEFMANLEASTTALHGIIETDYSNKVLVSSTHEKFRETLEQLGFREISLEEIAKDYPELLAYFTERHPDIIRFIKE